MVFSYYNSINHYNIWWLTITIFGLSIYSSCEQWKNQTTKKYQNEEKIYKKEKDSLLQRIIKCFWRNTYKTWKICVYILYICLIEKVNLFVLSYKNISCNSTWQWSKYLGFEWWPRNGGEHWIPYHSQKKSPFTRNSFFFLFLSIPFFVEKYRTKTFLVKFDKEQAFLPIPAILFLYVPFLFVPRVPEKVTSQSLNLQMLINFCSEMHVWQKIY